MALRCNSLKVPEWYSLTLPPCLLTVEELLMMLDGLLDLSVLFCLWNLLFLFHFVLELGTPRMFSRFSQASHEETQVAWKAKLENLIRSLQLYAQDLKTFLGHRDLVHLRLWVWASRLKTWSFLVDFWLLSGGLYWDCGVRQALQMSILWI